MSRTASNHDSNRFESQFEFGWNIDWARLNHETNRVKFWVEQGKIMSQIGSNLENNRFESCFEYDQIIKDGSDRVESWVKLGQVGSQTLSNHESNMIKSWDEQGRSSRKVSIHRWNRVESWIERDRKSNMVKWWFEHGRIMSQTGSNREESYHWSNCFESRNERGRIMI